MQPYALPGLSRVNPPPKLPAAQAVQRTPHRGPMGRGQPILGPPAQTVPAAKRTGAIVAKSFQYAVDGTKYLWNSAVSTWSKDIDKSKEAKLYAYVHGEMLTPDGKAVKAAVYGLPQKDIDFERQIIQRKLAIACEIRGNKLKQD